MRRLSRGETLPASRDTATVRAQVDDRTPVIERSGTPERRRRLLPVVRLSIEKPLETLARG
jgi:hypothetical protein